MAQFAGRETGGAGLDVVYTEDMAQHFVAAPGEPGDGSYWHRDKAYDKSDRGGHGCGAISIVDGHWHSKVIQAAIGHGPNRSRVAFAPVRAITAEWPMLHGRPRYEVDCTHWHCYSEVFFGLIFDSIRASAAGLPAMGS